jgi:hypothetical protein
MSTAKDWIVRLGPHEWARFTYERSAGPEMPRLLGSVQRGASIGALAMLPSGDYVQLNGDHETPLNARHVRKAIAKAEAMAARRPTPLPRRAAAPAVPVVVTVRRRRVAQRPPGEN